MNTSYNEIYTRFLSKITDYDLSEMTDEELIAYCNEYLISSIPKLTTIEHDLFMRDDVSFEFELNETEIEIVACQMVVEWVDRKIHNTQLIHMFVGTKDDNMASQANHMKALIELKKEQKANISTLIRDYSYKTMFTEG